MIISYPASPSRIIVLLKTLRHIIKKKSEREERSFRENRKKEIIFSIKCNKHCFQKLHADVQAEESRIQTSVPWANLIQMKTHFQYIDDLEHYFTENCQKQHT